VDPGDDECEFPKSALPLVLAREAFWTSNVQLLVLGFRFSVVDRLRRMRGKSAPRRSSTEWALSILKTENFPPIGGHCFRLGTPLASHVEIETPRLDNRECAAREGKNHEPF
jgi:hypothetical protein